jgi:TolA-binding protein
MQRPSGGFVPQGRPAGGNRPGAGGGGTQWNRPGAGGGGNRPGAGGGGTASNRPGAGGGFVPQGHQPGGNRPGAGGGGTQWNRPGAGGGGTAWNRPGAGGGGTQWNRPGAGGGGTAWNRPGAGGSGTAWNRPGGGNGSPWNRPGAGGSGTQWNRPGGGGSPWNRPGAGGSGTQWNRPDGGGGVRPGWNGGGTAWNRPDNGGNNRPGPRPGGIFGNNTNIGSGGNTVVNRPINSGNTVNANRINSATVNKGGNVYAPTTNVVNAPRTGVVNAPRTGVAGVGGYYGRAYGGWHAGSWGGWSSYPSFWGGAATAGVLGPAAVASFDYSNPYGTPAVQQVYNYSQPIPAYTDSQPAQPTVVVNAAPSQTTDVETPAAPGVVAPDAGADESPPAEQAPAQQDPKVQKAVGLFDDGRALFKEGDYAGAQSKADQAIRVLPEDRVPHEFRGLTLFAQGKYPEAAQTLYAVLAGGPGWNWDTLQSFYPDVDTYTRQLRALEAHAKAHPKAAEDAFVLAYQYLALEDTDAAIAALEQVRRLQPKDQLSAEILKALKTKPAKKQDGGNGQTG